jgi:hypothetical protein
VKSWEANGGSGRLGGETCGSRNYVGGGVSEILSPPMQ